MKRVIILPDGTRIEVEHGAFEDHASSADDTVIITSSNVSSEDLKELIDKVEQIDNLKARGEAISGRLEQERLTERIEAWPDEWEDFIEVSLYGSIEITSSVEIPHLGISISAVKEKGTFAFQNFWTYPCRVKVKSKDWAGVSDAVNRLELFLNAWHLTSCWSGSSPIYGAGCSIHYYCSLLSAPYAIISELGNEFSKIQTLLVGFDSLRRDLRTKILHATWWMRQARHDLLSGTPNTSIFVLFAATWNAFECLVDVACEVIPPKKLSKQEKNEKIREYLENLDGPPKASHIDHCYRSFVRFSFKDKVQHVFNLMIDKDVAEKSFDECFTIQPTDNQLYRIRNDIDHGNIVEYEIESRIRVIEGLERLQKIVLPLFAWLTRYHEALAK